MTRPGTIPIGLSILAFVLGCHSGMRTGARRDAATDAGGDGTNGTADAGPHGMLALVAGKPGGPGDLDGVADGARFREPFALAMDGADHFFVTDRGSHVIRRVDVATATVSTFAGSPGIPGTSDGTGTAARFNNPGGIVADGAGNLFVADAGNHTIRKIVVTTGAVTTFAGAAGLSGSSDGIAAAARFFTPVGLAGDGAGNLFVADAGNNSIRRIVAATGAVTTLAGLAGTPGYTDGIGAAARFTNPTALAYDGGGNLFVADTSANTIRKVDLATGTVTTVAGLPAVDDGVSPYPQPGAGSADGIGRSAGFWMPAGITSDGAGNLFVADQFNCTIRSIAIATGLVTTLVGSAQMCTASDGVGPAAHFAMPSGVVTDHAGNLYVSDLFGYGIKKVVIATREVSTVAGSTGDCGSTDGIGEAARFYFPAGLAGDGDGNLFVADRVNRAIRKLDLATRTVTLFAGSPELAGGARDGIATAARFTGPQGMAADGLGDVFVADFRTIRKIVLATGQVTTLAGAAEDGTADGIGAQARFANPIALASDGAGALFVVDQGNFNIRRVDTATGAVTTFAGVTRAGGSADGIGTKALFFNSSGITSDGSGNLYVADTGNHTIRKLVIATAQVTTLAGAATVAGSVDGQGGSARFASPTGIVCDGQGHLFVGDVDNRTIRKVDIASGAVTTVAGTAHQMGVVLGPLPAGLAVPTALAMGPSGELLIADSGENVILAAWF
jgi:sugar lactone lactonase YvrE